MLADVLQNEPGFHTEQPRVLIVEDEFLIAMDIEDSILQAEEEADVIGIANRLEEAVALGSRADIAFVDVNLADGQTGPEIGRRLSEDHGVVVIFMTANPEVVVNLGIGSRRDRQARAAGCRGAVPCLRPCQTRRHPCRNAHRHDGFRLR